MKVVIVANCQARAINWLIEAPGITRFNPIIIHLSKQDDEQAHNGIFDQADLIIAQRVDENYPVNHLKTSRLKNDYGGKTLVIPNLYFTGQTPDLFVLRDKNYKPIIGPLDTYHHKSIYDFWTWGINIEEATQKFVQGDHPLFCREVGEKSLRELRARENDTDIVVSDFIGDHWLSERLFFVFNHPNLQMLRLLATRVIKTKALPIIDYKNMRPGDQEEPLGAFRPFATDAQLQLIGCAFGSSNEAVSFKLKHIDNVTSMDRSSRKRWTSTKFIEESYRIYDEKLAT
ncbi:MAG: WcbI family polysaccharide biosynthesis putative acetyltransferase [Pseudomonadota bacterium]